MAKKFNTYVVVHKDPAEDVWFAPGDEVPDWALELVGDHVYGGDHEADDEVDVRLTDPHYEDDDPDTQFQTAITLPPEEGGTVEDVDDEESYEDLTKDQLKELAEERGLAHSGTKAELVARLEEYDAADEEDDEE
jgi:hypothetical protein